MNKSELIDAIAEKGGVSKSDAGKALDATIASITEALKSGDTVTLVGFGTFSVKERAARTGRATPWTRCTSGAGLWRQWHRQACNGTPLKAAWWT